MPTNHSFPGFAARWYTRRKPTASTILPKTEPETRLMNATLLLLRAALTPAKNNPMHTRVNNTREATANFQWVCASGNKKCSPASADAVESVTMASHLKKVEDSMRQI